MMYDRGGITADLALIATGNVGIARWIDGNGNNGDDLSRGGNANRKPVH